MDHAGKSVLIRACPVRKAGSEYKNDLRLDGRSSRELCGELRTRGQQRQSAHDCKTGAFLERQAHEAS